MKIETRRFQVRAVADGNTFAGLALPYGGFSEVLNDRARPYRERFTRGAMNTSEQTVALYGHDPTGVPLARVGAETLRFKQTAEGLEFSMDLPESRPDIREALHRGDLTGAVSVGFYVKEDGEEWQTRTKPAVRTVRSAELVELSVVPIGAYPQSLGTMIS